nr:uncharacterized protein LOC126535771 [Dermacentor andersoni]
MTHIAFQEFFPKVAAWEGNWSVILACLAVILGGLLTIKNFASKNPRAKDKRLPPGPRGIPLLGYLPFIWKPYHVVFQELSEKYGPIIRLQLGIKDVVVLNDVASVREGLSNSDVLYRSNDFVFNYLDVNGIAALNGEAWLVNRRYCFHVLRNLGFAKKSMEEHIHEELECFLQFLASGKGQPMRIAQPLAASVANNISALVFGRRYDLEDPKGRYFEGLLSMFLRNADFFCVMDFLPVVRTLASYIPNSKLRIMNYVMKELTQHVRDAVKEHEENMDYYAERDFIDGYLRKIKENKGTDCHYTMKYLEGNAINFYGPSTNPVRTVILWNLYIAASDPDGQQARVQREIDSVVGRQRAPEWQDRLRMPYTIASILETLRWRTSSPLSLHRVAGRDTVIGGYHVPAGTLVVPNMWSLNNDPAIWRNPSQFDPTRFLNTDGTEVDEKPLAFIPFSVGRRACPGETLALMEVFLYVTTVLQKFKVLPEEGKHISLDIERALLTVVDDTQGLRFLSRMFAWETTWLVSALWLAPILVSILFIVRLTAGQQRDDCKRLPPGPKGVPILGYIPFMRKPFHVIFHELSKVHGPIVGLRLGSKDVVVLNDLASIREGLANPDVLYRPDDFIFRYLGVRGILTMNGEPWQVNRRYTFHVLRNLGFAKKSMEEHIREEVQDFTDYLLTKNGRPTLVGQTVAASVANNISALVFGRRYNRKDPEGRFIEKLLTSFLRHSSFLSLVDFLPAIRFITAYIPNTRTYITNNLFKEFAQLVREEVEKREGNMEMHLDRDFLDGYLRKIQEHEGTESHYSTRYLEGTTINLYGASTNTVRSTILWNLYIAANDPDGHQKQLQREIDNVVGHKRSPQWQDRYSMPFTMASILESLRWRTMAPISIHRAAGRDTVIGGYHIPAGTLIVPNLWAVHNDPACWLNPSKYDPTRFLSTDGTKLNERPRAFMPFSLGRRACPGESLALMEIFLYVTTVLQKFKVLPKHGTTLSFDIQHVLISAPNDAQALRFISR